VELTGESFLAAPRSAVWAALNDPAVLARCIDGVETLTSTTDASGATRFDGKMNARVGPVRATFAGGVTLTEVDAPNRYVLVGEGKGGVAGFAKGSAEVRLSDATVDGRTGTQLDYTVSSSVGGKLAQLGARLIEGTARGYAETFFARLKAEIETPGPVAAPLEPDPEVNDANALHGTDRRTGLTPLVWGGIILIAVLLVLAWQLR
jgi:carbon monoxide dehydrogenase subunit G